MSNVEHQREVLIRKRARALAMMLLTGRDDLLIEEVQEDIGLDYLVRFHKGAKQGLREFGVVVCGSRAAVSKEHADKLLRPHLQRLKRYGPFARPVCFFFETMENDESWYSWAFEPIASTDAKVSLRLSSTPDCRQLDKKALQEIIDRVDQWYEALLSKLVVNGPAAKGERAKP